MSIRKNFLVKLICVLFILFSFSTLKSVTAIGFSDPENDVWHSQTNEKIEMRWMDIINVYTYGSSIVIECLDHIPIEDAIPIDFLVLFSNDNDETNWEAAIYVQSLGFSNLTTYWVIGNLEEVTAFDWNLDPIGTHFSFFENKLTMFFTEFDDVSTSTLSVEVTAELEDDRTHEMFLLKDWAPDQYQPQDFEVPEINDTPPEEPTSADFTSDFISSTTSSTNLSWFLTLLSIPLMYFLYKRRKGL